MREQKKKEEERKEGFVVLSSVKLLHVTLKGRWKEDAVCDKQCFVQNYSVIE